jgi:hypothetical protein
MAGKPHLPKEARDVRDTFILRAFLGGASEREIAIHRTVQLSPSQVHRIIIQQLELAGERYGLISERALVVYNERLEVLIRAIWTRATARDADPKAIEIARRLLDQQSKLFQLTDENRGMPIAPIGDNELAQEVADLVEYRERHRKPPRAAPAN